MSIMLIFYIRCVLDSLIGYTFHKNKSKVPVMADISVSTDLSLSLSYKKVYDRQRKELLSNLENDSDLHELDSSSEELCLKTENERAGLLVSNHNRSDQTSTQEASKGRKLVTMIVCLYLHLAAMGLGFGLGVVYVELISRFNSPRSSAALVQSLYQGCAFGK